MILNYILRKDPFGYDISIDCVPTVGHFIPLYTVTLRINVLYLYYQLIDFQRHTYVMTLPSNLALDSRAPPIQTSPLISYEPIFQSV